MSDEDGGLIAHDPHPAPRESGSGRLYPIAHLFTVVAERERSRATRACTPRTPSRFMSSVRSMSVLNNKTLMQVTPVLGELVSTSL